MDAKITVAPFDPTTLITGWQPTPELRWIVPNVTNAAMPKLQQRWIERFSGQTDWRTVPLEVVSSQEFFGA